MMFMKKSPFCHERYHGCYEKFCKAGITQSSLLYNLLASIFLELSHLARRYFLVQLLARPKCLRVSANELSNFSHIVFSSERVFVVYKEFRLILPQ